MAQDAARKDFSRLELTKAAFDLSDRGVDGLRRHATEGAAVFFVELQRVPGQEDAEELLLLLEPFFLFLLPSTQQYVYQNQY